MSAPKAIKVNRIPRRVAVRRANAYEKSGLKKLMEKVIDQMMVCEEGPHKGQFIACHKTEKGEWNNILTYLTSQETMEVVQSNMLRTKL